METEHKLIKMPQQLLLRKRATPLPRKKQRHGLKRKMYRKQGRNVKYTCKYGEREEQIRQTKGNETKRMEGRRRQRKERRDVNINKVTKEKERERDRKVKKYHPAHQLSCV
jgi:hypothetical protein